MGSNLVLVPEPVAAAAHFASFPGQTLAPNQALAVYDLGAGTFDVAIVGATQKGFVVLAEAGLPDLGGLDVDQALLEHVGRQVSHREPTRWQSLLRPVSTGDRRAQRALREDVKAAKESLSRHPQTEVPMPEPFDDVLVTRVELEALIRPGLLRSVELLAGTIRSTGMTPDRLVGIYLVGGSSRIPLIATLIAEQLRVVPTSLDQPETAVALGAHHVPQEGVTMRTSDISNTIEDVQRTQQVVAPRSGGFAAAGAPQAPAQAASKPAQSAFPNSGPQRVQGPPPPNGPPSGPSTGPPSVPTPVMAMGSGPQPAFGPPPAPAGQSSNRNWYIATAVVAVLVIAVVSILIATSGDSGGGGTASGADCENAEADDKGFTECMRQLAGAVVEKNDCQKGATNPLGGQAMETPGATTASCSMADDYTVMYVHFDKTEDAKTYLDTIKTQLENLGATGVDPEEGTWDGDGMAGTYTSVDLGLGNGMLVFQVDDSPVAGVLMHISADSTSSGSGLQDFFDQHVKPGSDGGA
jgi:hypothetical protein